MRVFRFLAGVLGAVLLAISPALAQDAKPDVMDALNAAKRTQPNMRFTIDRRVTRSRSTE